MRTFRSFDGNFAYREHGEGHGEAVILIHGFPMNHKVWEATLGLLSSGRHYVLPDLRGFGQSTAALSGNNTLTRLAQDITELLDHLRIKRAHVVGASLGGMIALKLAFLEPQRLHSVAILNTVARAEKLAGRDRRNRQLEAVRSEGVAKFAWGFAKGLFPKDAPASAIEFLVENMSSASIKSVVAGLELLRDREDQTAQLKYIKVPALMIAGDCDKRSSPQIMGEMAGLCLRGSLRTIEGAGHMPTIQMPALAASILEDWLTEQEGRNAA